MPSIRRLPLSILFLMLFVLYAVPPTAYLQDAGWENRFNHYLRITLSLPQGFELAPNSSAVYQSSDQRIELDWYNSLKAKAHFDGSVPLGQFCNKVAQFWGDSYSSALSTEDANICLYKHEGPSDTALMYLKHFPRTSTKIPLVALRLIAPDDDIRQIASSIDFVDTINARVYLDEALRLIQNRFIYIDKIDWDSIDKQALDRIDDTSTLDDAHQALTWVMTQLNAYDSGSHHVSRFFDPQAAANLAQPTSLRVGFVAVIAADKQSGTIALIYPNSPAEQAGLKLDDDIVTINGIDFADYKSGSAETLKMDIRRKNVSDIIHMSVTQAPVTSLLPVTGRRLSNDIGYIESYGLPIALSTNSVKKYIQNSQDLIQQIDTPATCGWIVDLRRNSGGGIVGVDSVLAPLRGDGLWFGWRFRAGADRHFYFDKGTVKGNGEPLNDVKLVDKPYSIQHLGEPMAVLVSPLTASSGEVNTFILQTRPEGQTRVFGETTRGDMRDGYTLTSLFDGALLQIVNIINLDAKGDLLPGYIQPDVTMATDFASYGTDDDPMIQTAQRWLIDQPECKK